MLRIFGMIMTNLLTGLTFGFAIIGVLTVVIIIIQIIREMFR